MQILYFCFDHEFLSIYNLEPHFTDLEVQNNFEFPFYAQYIYICS